MPSSTTAIPDRVHLGTAKCQQRPGGCSTPSEPAAAAGTSDPLVTTAAAGQNALLLPRSDGTTQPTTTIQPDQSKAFHDPPYHHNRRHRHWRANKDVAWEAPRREFTLLTAEVLSWRRTIGTLLVLVMLVTGSGASESPDRECCENPLYTFPDPNAAATTYRPPVFTYRPPEEPDLYPPPEVPDFPGTELPEFSIYFCVGKLGFLHIFF